MNDFFRKHSNVFFFCASGFCLFRPRVFSCALGPGARRESARSPLHKRGPWPGSVARALGLQSHENWQVTTGRHSEHVEPSRPMQTHIEVKKMSDGLRMSFRTLLTARTDGLPASCSCSSAPRAHARALVVVLSCSRAPRARARELLCPCSC